MRGVGVVIIESLPIFFTFLKVTSNLSNIEMYSPSWCQICEKVPVVITNTFSNNSSRQETKVCKDCGATLSITCWNASVKVSDVV